MKAFISTSGDRSVDRGQIMTFGENKKPMVIKKVVSATTAELRRAWWFDRLRLFIVRACRKAAEEIAIALESLRPEREK